MQYIELNDDYYWSANSAGFAIGEISNSWTWGSIRGAEDTFDGGEVYAIFDTGSSAIIMPEEYFSNFLTDLYASMSGNEYELSAGYVVTKCYNDFPVVHFLFDNKWISVNPEHYVVDISDNGDNSLCVLLMSQGEQPFFVMGLPLYMDYYTVHEDENNRIGFTPRVGSSKSPLIDGRQPDRTYESEDPEAEPVSFYSWLVSSIILLAFICCWACIIIQSLENRGSQVNGLTISLVAIGFIFVFGFVIYFWLQPIINNIIIDNNLDPVIAEE